MSDTDAAAAALSKAIAALEAQRAVLGDAITDAALAPLRAQLSAQHVAAPRRRQVSVLFLDIVGSTSLSRTLDPEEIHDIMDRARTEARKIEDHVLTLGFRGKRAA